MKRKILASLLSLMFLFGASSSYADTSSFDKEYFKGAEPQTFTEQERKNLQNIKKFKEDKNRQSTVFSSKGDIIYAFGKQQAVVVCSVLNVCDLELEEGESINSVNIGDPTRWSVEPAVTGSENGGQTQHVLIKPLDINLKTNLIIATDRRAYRVDLKSSETQYYPHVKFSYPEKLLAQFKQQQLVEKEKKDKNSITVDKTSGSKTYMGDLNFEYEVTGNVSWKPVRVYDDGRKTIIEMPKTMEYAKAPALMLLADKGGLFTDEQTEIINYRLQDNRFIVDGVFETAILTKGIDRTQQRVVIKRKKK